MPLSRNTDKPSQPLQDCNESNLQNFQRHSCKGIQWRKCYTKSNKGFPLKLIKILKQIMINVDTFKSSKDAGKELKTEDLKNDWTQKGNYFRTRLSSELNKFLKNFLIGQLSPRTREDLSSLTWVTRAWLYPRCSCWMTLGINISAKEAGTIQFWIQSSDVESKKFQILVLVNPTQLYDMGTPQWKSPRSYCNFQQ